MQIETSRFGTIEVPEDELVTFVDGLPGFPGARQMALLGGGAMPGGQPLDGHHALFWLQDVTDPDLAFLTIVPWSAYPDYDFEIDPVDLPGAGGVDTPSDLCILAIVTVRRENGGVRLTSNLRAPVVIDASSRLGWQVILGDSDWPLQAPLAEVAPSASAGSDR
jgi:flagellar assembly factor FliW